MSVAPKSRSTPRDLADSTFVAADGYAAMFEDAPPPTEADLCGLEPSAPLADTPESAAADAPPRRLRIAS